MRANRTRSDCAGGDCSGVGRTVGTGALSLPEIQKESGAKASGKRGKPARRRCGDIRRLAVKGGRRVQDLGQLASSSKNMKFL